MNRDTTTNRITKNGHRKRRYLLYPTFASVKPPSTTAAVGVHRFTNPDADWYAVTADDLAEVVQRAGGVLDAPVHRRRFAHFDLSGGMTVDDEEILESEIERVVCRWCQRDDAIVADAKTA